MRLTAGVALLLLAGTVRAAEGPSQLQAQIAPLLAERCLTCHSGGEPQGGLDLTRRAAALAGGESGEPAMTPGDAEASLLWQYVRDEEMPPKHPLPDAEKELLKQWIDAGAAWSDDPIDPLKYTTAGRAGYDWWSLQPLARPAVPTAEPSGWGRTPVDAFVLKQLQAQGLTPSPPADRRALIRRLSFDLLGLPPTPREIAEFESDPAPNAYARLVERLLASPQYGERWARHWLDVARFGESDGFEYDRMRPYAWPYRDWVVAALNADLPYDEFARLQLAGDVLAPDDRGAVTATGFLVGGAFDGLIPSGDKMRQIMRQDELEDLVGTVGQTFLGLTVHCARCHDHKFDPIRQAEYYQIASALSGVRRGERTLYDPRELTDLDGRRKALQQQLAGLDALDPRTALLPRPVASWDFSKGLSDELNELPLTLNGGATLSEGRLKLDGFDSYAETRPLPFALREKTLEVWVQLENVEQQGGGVLSLQSLDGNTFDALVFAERQPRRWLAGSNFFSRTRDFDGPAESNDRELTQVAVVYATDGQITAYRNGQPYGRAYQSNGPVSFAREKSQLLLGLRHTPARADRLFTGQIARARIYDRALTADQIAASFDPTRLDQEATSSLTPEQERRREQLREELRTIAAQRSRLLEQRVFCVMPTPAPVAQLLLRGSPFAPAGPLAAGGIAALHGPAADFGLPPDAPEGERRKRLAAWITSRENGLFARTIVNRVWHYHFGQGLVATPSDLGFNGGRPTHPELLEWLASELVENGYRLKTLHRRIVLSATYQQSSAVNPAALQIDADNRWLWRKSPQRLDAESARDAMLAISGDLNPALGGPSFQDFKTFVQKSTQYYEPIDAVGPQFNRRTLYRMWARGGRNPLLDAFDCPDPSAAAPARGVTNTPLQSLTLLNNAFVLHQADRFAARLQREAPGALDRQAALGVELAYGRPPSPRELQLAASFAERHGLAALCRVLLNSNGFLFVE